MASAVEEHFSGLVLRLPPGLVLASSTQEEVPSPVPGLPPSVERFRRYAGEAGVALHLFHFEGVHLRDRGPLSYAATWALTVDGRAVTAGRTRLFFGRPQEVLVAHLVHPAPSHGRYLVYATGMDRPVFDRLMEGIRFEGVAGPG